VNKDFSEGLDHKSKGVCLFVSLFFKATQMLVITSSPEEATLMFQQQQFKKPSYFLLKTTLQLFK